MRSSTLCCIAVLAASSFQVGDASMMCILPEFAGAARPCKSDADCCAGLACDTDSKCVSKTTATLNAAETAFVANLVVMDATASADQVGELLKNASKAIAEASKELETIIDKKVEASKIQVAEKQDAVNKKASETFKGLKGKADDTTHAAKDKVKTASSSVKSKATDVQKKGAKTMDDLKKKGKEILDGIALKLDTKTANAAVAGAASSSPGGDYTKYYSAYTGGKKDTTATTKGKKKKTTNSAAATPAGGSPGGFDWSKFVGAGGAKKDDKKSTGSASPGGFDWSKFVGAGGAKKDDKKNAAAAGPGGFDFKKFTPPMGGKNAAAAGPGGFDFGKFTNGGKGSSPGAGYMKPSGSSSPGGDFAKTPKGITGTATTKSGAGGDFAKPPKGLGISTPGTPPKFLNSATETTTESAPPLPPQQQQPSGADAGAGGQPAPGTEGAACGDTAYVDFGACKKGLKCERNPIFSKYAPGKCAKDEKRRVLLEDTVTMDQVEALLNNVETSTTTPPGAKEGVCGKWNGVDFGECKPPYTCTDIGSKYGLPNVCKEPTTTNAAVADQDTQTTDADPDVPTDDADDAATIEQKKKLAEAANKAALAAADQAEIVANKLLAGAAKVREAAQKLLDEANKKAADTTTTADASTTSMLASTTSTSSHLTLILLTVVAVASAFVVWRRSSRNEYHRI